ncbi:MAG: hypothetical protein HRF42_06090 [Candidatus Brocadia sp.]|jgi:hypothetical protein
MNKSEGKFIKEYEAAKASGGMETAFARFVKRFLPSKGENDKIRRIRFISEFL